jgi:uncharacterized phiE125 gp8 family phage protein
MMPFPSSLSFTDTLISSMADASPPVSALTLAYAKQHIRALGTADDTLTAVRIDAAAMYFERVTGRQLLTATREAWLDAFPFLGASGACARIELPHPPLQSVVSVSYLTDAGVLQSYTGGSPVANLYRISAPAGPYAARGWVEPIGGGVWPIAGSSTGSVRIRYTCGYGNTPDDIPALARGVLCFLVAHFDTFPSAVQEARGQVLELPFGVQAMIDGFRYSALPSQVLRSSQVLVPPWP